MDIGQPFFKSKLLSEWNEDIALLKNIQQIAENAYAKALHDIQKLNRKGNNSQSNALTSLQSSLMSFIINIKSQHSEMIQNIKEDVIPDIIDNLQIQKMYKDDYLAFLNEQKQEEEDIILHYQTLLQQYNESDASDEASSMFEECEQVFSILQNQRETDEKAFLTIVDNYCRIRCNNQSITVSAIRKLLVYMSSAIANTQFDIQMTSQKLTTFPNGYETIKKNYQLPHYHQGKIYAFEPPRKRKGITSSLEIVKCHSEEPETPIVGVEVWNYPTKSADNVSVCELNDIYPLSVRLLKEISLHKNEVDPFIIRSILSILTSQKQDEIQQSSEKVKKYLQTNEIAKKHTCYLLLSVILFVSPEKTAQQNFSAFSDIIQTLFENYPEISIDVYTVLTNYCS